MTMKTRGQEQFEHLNDKSSLLIFMLEDEAKEVSDLRETVNALKRERNEIKKINTDLQSATDLDLTPFLFMDIGWVQAATNPVCCWQRPATDVRTTRRPTFSRHVCGPSITGNGAAWRGCPDFAVLAETAVCNPSGWGRLSRSRSTCRIATTSTFRFP